LEEETVSSARSGYCQTWDGTYNNADVTFYIPCSEVTSKLDVTPLEA